MGRQVNFFMLAEDEEEFLDFVLKEDKVRILRAESQSPEFLIKRSMLFGQPHRFMVYFWNSSLGVFTSKITEAQRKMQDPTTGESRPIKEAFYYFDDTSGPVIQYIPSVTIVNGKLRSGRIWAEMAYFDGTRWIAKNDEFIRWYEQVARWIRRNLKLDNRTHKYMSERVVQWREKGGELARY